MTGPQKQTAHVSERQTGQRFWTIADLGVIAELLDLEPTVLLAEVSRRARPAKDARDAAILGRPRQRPDRAPDRTAAQQPRRKRRSAEEPSCPSSPRSSSRRCWRASPSSCCWSPSSAPTRTRPGLPFGLGIVGDASFLDVRMRWRAAHRYGDNVHPLH